MALWLLLLFLDRVVIELVNSLLVDLLDVVAVLVPEEEAEAAVAWLWRWRLWRCSTPPWLLSPMPLSLPCIDDELPCIRPLLRLCCDDEPDERAPPADAGLSSIAIDPERNETEVAVSRPVRPFFIAVVDWRVLVDVDDVVISVSLLLLSDDDDDEDDEDEEADDDEEADECSEMSSLFNPLAGFVLLLFPPPTPPPPLEVLLRLLLLLLLF